MPRIIIDGRTKRREVVGKKAEYAVEIGTNDELRLKFWQQDLLKIDAEIRPGTVYALTYGKAQHPASFTPYKAPLNKTDLVADLIGAPVEARCSAFGNYDEKIRRWKRGARKEETHKGYSGGSYKVYYSGVPEHRQYCVACFISEAITVPEIIHLLPLMIRTGFPEEFIRRIITNRLNVPKERWDEIRKNTKLIDL